MTNSSALTRLVQQEALNFHLTNSIPRRLATRCVGWFSHIENPLVCAASLQIWRMFTELDLSDAEQTHYRSMHDCFTRRLKPGARPIDPDPAILVSPCDAILGAAGRVEGTQLFQIKGRPYSLEDLFGDPSLVETYRNGQFATLRLTSAMYHRFHAPMDLRVQTVTHIFGDTWNVNPVTLKRIDRIFCKNERVLITGTLPGSGYHLTLVAVAAILVAGIKLAFLDLPIERRRSPRCAYDCNVPLEKGAEMGWFEHGSTILVFAPKGFNLCPSLDTGTMIRVGQPLMRLPKHPIAQPPAAKL